MESIKKAIAIRYKKDQDKVPIISAKGKGEIAKQIIKIAKENNIVIQKDEHLANNLVELDINSQIPIEAFAAVAEILNYVYKIDKFYRSKNGN